MSRKIILIADDEPDILNTIKLSLEMEGYEVITALDGKEALEKARSKNPDLIILDVMLPDIDGYEISRRLKFDESYKHIGIIIVTARAQKVDQELWKDSRADLHMIKPFELDILNNMIKMLLGRYNG